MKEANDLLIKIKMEILPNMRNWFGTCIQVFLDFLL